jgi:competence ComEA-like helix-hairpin-helix protein
VARGLVIAAVLAAFAGLTSVALRRTPLPTPFTPTPDGAPIPVCTAPVEADDASGARVLCAGSAELGGCERLRAGERVLLGANGECRRVDGGMRASLRVIYGLRLDINSASTDDLRLLDGIGPKLAQAIVEDRARNGRFGAIGDLRRVRGVGPLLLQRLAGSIMVEPEPAPAPDPKP